MLMTNARRYFSRHSTLVKHFPVFNPEERHKAASELKACVEAGEDCLGYQVESLITNISLELHCRDQDLITLMKACSQDIKDYFPEQQKRLTLNAYNAAQKQLNCLRERRSPYFHFSALNAFLFQRVEFDPDTFFSELQELRINPDQRFLEGILGYYCRNQDMEKALDLLLYEKKNVQVNLNGHVAGHLIYGHCSRGEHDEAVKIDKLLKERDIFQKKAGNNFVTGTARYIDLNRNLHDSSGIEQLQKYVTEYRPSDSVLLGALVDVAGTEGEAIIMDGIYRNKSSPEELSSIIRRPVKQLLEKNYTSLAEQLVLKTVEEKLIEIKTNYDVNVTIEYTNPSVIICADLVENETSPNKVVSKIYNLESVFPNILEAAIILLADLSFEDKTKFTFCETVIKTLLDENKSLKFKKRFENLVGLNAKDRVYKASSENDVLFILKNYSDLGLMLKHDDVFKFALFKLIPNPFELNHKELFAKVHEIRDKLDCISQINGGMYSTSVLWSHIFKFLLSVRTEISFITAASLLKSLRRCYGPKRLFNGLGYSVLAIKDVKSFVDFLEVSYNDCDHRKDGEDYRTLCKSLLVCINVAKKNEEDISELLKNILEEMVFRNLPLHDHHKARILKEKPELSNIVEQITVIDTFDYRNKIPRAVKKKYLVKSSKPNA